MAIKKMEAKQQTKITREQIVRVLELIEAGEPETSACRTVGINRATFRSAALKHEVADLYARALEGLATAQVEKLECAIEDMRSGKIDHNVARVEIDARKWFASKFLPKRFGDKIDVTSDGEKMGAAVSAEQLDQLIKARTGRADL